MVNLREVLATQKATLTYGVVVVAPRRQGQRSQLNELDYKHRDLINEPNHAMSFAMGNIPDPGGKLINEPNHAMSFAMGNIPDPGGKFSVGIGAGSFEGENALAFGLKARPTNTIVVSASLATADNDATGMVAGVSWSF